MALKKSTSNIPKNAVVLEERDAIKYQWDQIFNWKPKSDMWAFRYGSAAISGIAAISSGYMLNFFRKKLKMRHVGYLTSMVSGMVAPALGSGLLHTEFVANDILIFKTPCPVCLQMRSAGIQFATGILYPLIFAPIICSVLALNLGIRIPHYTEKLKILKMWGNFAKPMLPVIGVLVGLNMITASVVTYFEIKQFYNLQETLSNRRLKMTPNVTSNKT